MLLKKDIVVRGSKRVSYQAASFVLLPFLFKGGFGVVYQTTDVDGDVQRIKFSAATQGALVARHRGEFHSLVCSSIQHKTEHCTFSTTNDKFLTFGATMRHSLSLLLVYALAAVSFASSDYHEQLVLTPLHPSLLLASFNFQSNTSWASFEQQNFRYFPRSLGQILKHANTRELHLRFSLGRWDAENWGARPWGGTREGGTGVELWAWVEAETDEEFVRHF